MTDLHYDRHHDQHGDSPDRVLLVMGLGMPGHLWEPVVSAIGLHYASATFDHRGVGKTPGPARSSMAELASDTLSVLDALGWPKTHLVGVSMGGMIAQELALAAPHRFHSLTLVATHSGGPLAVFPPVQGLFTALTATTRAKRLQRLLHPPALRAQMQHRGEAVALAPRATVFAHLRAVRNHDTRARLGTLALPTLVVKPGLDQLVRPSHNDRLASAIPGATLAVLPHAGHGLLAHATNAFVEQLLTHWKNPR